MQKFQAPLKHITSNRKWITRFFISNTFISNARLKSAKNQGNAKQYSTLRLSFCYLKIIRFLHPRYHQKLIGDILKMYKKQVRVFKRGYIISGNEKEAENEK